jgi:hypothetical protein
VKVPVRILILTHAQYITVALPKLIELAESCAALGHDIILVATSRNNRLKGERFKRNGVQYVVSPSILWGNWRHGADLYDAVRRIWLLKSDDFDIIHAVDSRPSVIFPALFLRRLKRVPLVLEWSDWFGRGGSILDRSGWIYAATIGKVETFFEEGFRLKADAATVISTRLRNRLIEMGFAEDKILLHRMGCPTELFNGESSYSARSKLGLPQNRLICGYFGRIYSGDHRMMLEAFEAVKEVSDAWLYLVGDIEPPRRQLPERVVYAGRVSDQDYRLYLEATEIGRAHV